ncbi:hypothetical protein ACP275_03G034000 [Erythranthe tilingii]
MIGFIWWSSPNFTGFYLLQFNPNLGALPQLFIVPQTSLWRTTPRLIICSLTPTWGQNNNFCWRTAQRLIIWSLSPTWGQNSNFRFHHLPSSACSSFLLSYPSLGAFV